MKDSKTKNPASSKKQGLNDGANIQQNIDILTEGIHQSMNGISNDNTFPVDVFPKTVQDIIIETNDKLKFPIDFIGSSLLYAASVAIGNTHRIEIIKGYQQPAVVYIAIVSVSGTNKSEPLTFALKPIHDRDIASHKCYMNDKKEFEQNNESDPKENSGKPFWRQHILSDFTIESLNDVHRHNERGLGTYADELASWINNFNRYNSGSEEQYWLSVWSGKPIIINRKNDEPILIPHPFISVMGTTQPKTLKAMFKGKVDNGFLYRILTVLVKDLKKPYLSDNDIDQIHIDNWQVIIDKLLDVPLLRTTENDIDPVVLKPTPAAKKVFIDWQREITDKSNNSDNEIVKGIYAKIEMQCLRLSLILEIMSWACEESDNKNISTKSMKGAIKLCDYFFQSAMEVHEIVLSEDPVFNLPTNKQNLYNALPEYFTTGDGIKLAKDFELDGRTFRRFITTKSLFEKLKHGSYLKLL